MREPKLKELRDGLAGVFEQFRTRKHLSGIRPHGLQFEMFEAAYLEAGTEPAATHKGGAANAK